MQHSDGQKLNLEKDANQSPNSKVTDENEDFLQQIKAKVSLLVLSFSMDMKLVIVLLL